MNGKIYDKIDPLTSLRFFAALAIVIHHAKGSLLPKDFLEGIPLDMGVSFFFVLSGFILTHVYRSKQFDFYDFFTSRISRIWPAHLTAFLILILLIPSSEWVIGNANFPLVTTSNIFMLQSFTPIPAYYFSYNGPSWSISTEMAFYLAFPFLLFNSIKGFTQKALLIFFIGLAATLATWKINPNYYSFEKFDQFSGHGITYISPLTRVQEFFFGILGCYLFSKIKPTLSGRNLICSLLEAGCIIFIATWLGQAISNVYGYFAQLSIYLGNYYAHLAAGFIFSIFIGVFYINSDLISRVLSAKPLLALGEISFSLYLLHQIFLRFYAQNASLFSFISDEYKFPIYLAFSTLCAYVVWKFIESTSRTKLKNLLTSARKSKNPIAGT